MATTPASEPLLARFKTLHPKIIDLVLDRVLELLGRLGDPHTTLPPVIHVAGTNGKGSTVAYLRAMAEAAGQRCHVYISPHLVRFNERITVASEEINDTDLAALLEEIESVNAGRPITFFEITTAAAFLAFARQPADLCLLETGLGGRYDATNVIDRPAATLITSISLDHQAFLGDSLSAIAGEKAGIIKPGVPCLTVRQSPEAMEVIRKAADLQAAPLLVEGEHWQAEVIPDGLRFTMAGTTQDLPQPGLPGRHQFHNAGLALAAATHLRLAADLAAGLHQVRWPARLQRLTVGPLTDLLPPGWELWLDGGHNPGAGKVLARHLAQHWHNRPVYLVVGMLNSKDSMGFVDPLAVLVTGGMTVAIPGEVNSLSAAEMAAKAKDAGLDLSPAASVDAAMREIVGHAGPARILICGSLYLAGAVLAENN